MRTYVVLLGPPGAGKGTQARNVSEKLGLIHVSSGDIFRENMKNGTDLGSLAKQYLDSGELVPDNVTISMIKERISQPDCQSGVLLDGFPRTAVQAAALSELLGETGSQVDCVPLIEVPSDELVRRLSQRRSCPTCKRVYHLIHNPPEIKGVCNDDGTELIQREDDRPETVRHRIDVYTEQTAPLISYYQEKGVLAVVTGTNPIKIVTQDVLEAICKAAPQLGHEYSAQGEL
jgi:adenylate kinase